MAWTDFDDRRLVLFYTQALVCDRKSEAGKAWLDDIVPLREEILIRLESRRKTIEIANKHASAKQWIGWIGFAFGLACGLLLGILK